ncbi:MAG: phospholipase D-like domain-containing protein, partial [Butyrivibrio sp.]|nr:phospholipase D-like domain-containing protein [Butyrivibrio sp.]
MYDSFGSILKMPADFVPKMRKKGIKCYEFNSFVTVYGSRYNNRDHRKICVIDGNVAFTGGVNLADEYINAKEVYGHWKDTAIMLEGEAAWSMTVMFLSLWDGSFKEADDFGSFMPSRSFDYDDGYFIPYTDYPLDDEPVGKNVYLNIINRAKEHIYIMTPYLILDNVMVTALANAAKSGVDVRIITPGIPDKKIAFMLTRSYYEVLTNAGVAIYEYTPGFVHAKIFEADDKLAVVGTINLDYRSLAHHYENAVLIYGSSVIGHIKEDYAATLQKSRRVTYEDSRRRSFIKRILLPILRLFSPLF